MSWTKEELADFLEQKGIPAASYCFYDDKDDAICLDRVGGEWVIYYSERGTRNELAWAKSEPQALNIMKLFVLEAHQFPK
jgi:hypothetical protein